MRSVWGTGVVRSTRVRSRRLIAATALAGAVGLVSATASGSAAPVAHSASGSPNGLYGSLPPVGTPSKGGTITISQLTGSTPLTIFPIISAADASVYGSTLFINNMWIPVYNGPVGGTPKINMAVGLAASMPTFSNGDKTVTIKLKHGWKWSNGKPVTAKDVLFDIDLITAAVKESPANFLAYTPGQFPQSLTSAKVVGNDTIVMNLNKAYNPSYFTNDQIEANVYALPSTDWNVASAGGPHLDWTKPANAKKIYDYLSKTGSALSSFGSNPLWKIADGPFKIQSFNTTNSSWVMVPNADYGGSPKPSIAKLEGLTYTSITAQLNAIKTGAVDIAGVDFSQLGQVGQIESAGYTVMGYANLGWFGAFFNFKDKTGHFNSIVSQLYARQALAYLENQPAYLKGIFKNAGAVAYSTIPSVPPTPFTPKDAVTPPYPYNPGKAVSLLKSHGWKVVPGGQSTCQKPGSGAGECGAGIPKGTPFTFVSYFIPASETPSVSLESEALASEAKQAAGIVISLKEKPFNYIVTNFNDANPAAAKYTNAWGMINFGGYTDSYYPTTSSIFNIGGTYNQGGYTDPKANTLINNSVYSSNPTAVTNEASYLAKDLPVLFLPNADLIWAVSKKIGGPTDDFLALTQYTSFPQYWYVNK